ncbi:MAG TPA: lytic transglycosylase domain-containing protein [Streptosporangiaceae bacterium]|nr:lytic transglycosylase domain-containing protein [Streptosporangiaceae bacterium]
MTFGRGHLHADVKVAGSPPPDEQPPPPRSARHSALGPPDLAGGSPDLPGPRMPARKTGLIAAAAAVTVLVGGGTALALTGGGEDGESGTVAPARAASGIVADAMRQPTEAQARRMLADRAARAARRDAARRPVMAVRGTPPPKEKESTAAAAPAGNPVPAGEAQRIAKALMPRYGFNPKTQFGCLVELWDRESHWNVHAGSPGGPYGIPQANPGSKMASAGSNWLDSATTQIKWGFGYIKGRYGGPCDAWSHFQSAGWY